MPGLVPGRLDLFSAIKDVAGRNMSGLDSAMTREG